MRKLLLIALIILFFKHAYAQDRHYWSQMGGITAGLLGGSAIAGLRDNSSLYYNAAAMSFVYNPSISLGANTYRIRFLKIDNAYGKDLDEFYSKFVVNSDLIGGLLFSKKNDMLRFGYAIATRFLADNSFSSQITLKPDNGTTIIGDFDLQNKIQETWIKSSNSYKISDHLAWGLGFIIAVRSQNYTNYAGAKLIPPSSTDDVGRMDIHTGFEYWNVKGLVRLSFAVNYERFRFGWNATLPSINLFGNASIKREFSLLNYNAGDPGVPKDIVISGSESQLSSKHKYPFSSALGASFQLKNNDWIHFSTELFLPVKKYTVFTTDKEPTAFPEEALDSVFNKYFKDVTFLELSEQAKFVINFSAGYESFLSEKWGLLAGFRTDFNFDSKKDLRPGEIMPVYSTWDIYYLSGGVWGIFKNQKITTGLEVGITPNTKVPYFLKFDGAKPPEPPPGTDQDKSATARQLTLRLFLGIEINFVNKDDKNSK